MLTNLFVAKGDTKPDTDLIYMKKLNYALKKILEFYFHPGIKILDVTAGERRIWNPTTLQNTDMHGQKLYDVTFLDMSPAAKADIMADYTRLPFADNSFDLVVFDPPFMKPENGIEAFGIKTHITPDRDFYFRQAIEWVPPEARFFHTTKEFNRVSKNGLIVKIQERYEHGFEVPVLTYMDLAYNKRFNPIFNKSEFQRCVSTGYRGKRAGMGAKMMHPQRVLSYYAVYKKDYHIGANVKPKKTTEQKAADRIAKANKPRDTELGDF